MLRHAHDYIWADKSRPIMERLRICNLLYDAALEVAHKPFFPVLLEILAPDQER